MDQAPSKEQAIRSDAFLRRLAKDRSGNTLALIAAAIFPLLGMIGGGIDMGRAYLASSRLQQACDAGVLAARKRLGTETVVSGAIPSGTAAIGERFFNLNFKQGIYGTQNRNFQMTLEGDYAISGEASVDVPTSIMTVFGFTNVPVTVSCSAVLSVTELDIMMVLDTTGSMRHTNAGDTMTRIEALKQVIRDFHAQLEAAKAPGSTTRYGFVPYASNVNVGHLLEDSWVVNQWTYQSREATGATVPNSAPFRTYSRNFTYVSGTRSPWTEVSRYPSTYNTSTNPDQPGWYSCDQPAPPGDWSYTDTLTGTERTEVQTDPQAVLTIKDGQRVSTGTRYATWIEGTECVVKSATDTNYTESFEEVTEVPALELPVWRYKPVSRDVSSWRTETAGCIEERDTYEITDFDNVDLSQALDLDIDLVPSAGDPSTQWRPKYPEMIYARKFLWEGNGEFWVPQVATEEEYADSGNWWFSDCPAPAQKLQPMTAEEINTYLDTLTPFSATYHDIGMIWGARLISPTGLFAAENADVNGVPKTRHLIFLTDGQTEPYDLAYSAYGLDGLDRRRWTPTSSLPLKDMIEKRFGVACQEAKKRNVTVWVIAFATTVNQAMVDCAGEGRYFEAANAVELNNAFTTIAKSVGDLRLNR